jgi:Cu/Ag efflux pump CusA
VTPSLGPDATGVGWVYEYALIAKERSLAELRSLQDWSLRYGLSKAEGVAEIASVGGFVKQYNVVIDPQRLRSFDIPLSKVRSAIRASNMDFGGRTVELSEFEFVVRGRGYLKGIPDLRKIVLKNDGGTPVLLEDVARIELGPDERRGLTELNGDGEVASGIVLQRRDDLRQAIMLGAVERVRPKMMTVIAIIAGLLPIMWSAGTGSEVMQRIAVPMIGGMLSSTVLTLIVIPAVYGLIKGWRLRNAREAAVNRPVKGGATLNPQTTA